MKRKDGPVPQKFDHGKLRYDLIPATTTEGLAEVLTHGAEKYGADNWKNMPKEDFHRIRSAAMRHFEAYRAGEIHDQDSGMPHLWHVMANIAFLIDLDNLNQFKLPK